MNKILINLSIIFCFNLSSLNAQQALRFKAMSIADTTSFCEFVIFHSNTATDGFDQSFDAASMPPSDFVNYPWLYSFLAPNNKLVINSTGPLVNDKIIPFELYLGPATGMMIPPNTIDVPLKFRAKNQNTYPGSTVVLFVDSATTPVTVSNLQQAYNLTYNFNANTLYSNRFYLIITAPAKAEIKSCADFNTIKVSNPSSHWVNYSITSMATSSIIADSINFVGTAEYAGLAAGNYQVNFTNEIGMVSTQMIYIDSLPFSATINNNDTILDGSNASIQFNSSIYPVTSTSTYVWDFGDSTSSSLAAPNHVYDSIGNYQVILKATSSLGCIAYDTMSVQVSDFTFMSKNQISNNSFFVVDRTIHFKGNEIPTSFSIFSLDGKLIQRTQSPQRSSTININIAGVYIVKADYLSSQDTQKIILK